MIFVFLCRISLVYEREEMFNNTALSCILDIKIHLGLSYLVGCCTNYKVLIKPFPGHQDRKKNMWVKSCLQAHSQSFPTVFLVQWFKIFSFVPASISLLYLLNCSSCSRNVSLVSLLSCCKCSRKAFNMMSSNFFLQ